MVVLPHHDRRIVRVEGVVRVNACNDQWRVGSVLVVPVPVEFLVCHMDTATLAEGVLHRAAHQFGWSIKRIGRRSGMEPRAIHTVVVGHEHKLVM